MKHSFGLGVDADSRTGDTLAVYCKVRNGRSAQTKEFADGSVSVDYNVDGDLFGIEMLGPCSIEILERMTVKDAETHQSVTSKVPREVIVA